MTTKDRIRQLLANLDLTNQDLLDLSDDIWLGIDHNDAEGLKEGYLFKQRYNATMIEFSSVADQIQKLISEYTMVEVEDESTPPDVDYSEKERVVQELDRTQAYKLDDDFRYKRPYGYAFSGGAVKDLRTWRGLYERIANKLTRLHPEKASALASAEEFETNRGNRYFVDSPENLRLPVEIAPDIWAEMNLSANDIASRIQELLDYFGYNWTDFRVYLREDRDAQE